jgi:cysteine desulfurase
LFHLKSHPKLFIIHYSLFIVYHYSLFIVFHYPVGYNNRTMKRNVYLDYSATTPLDPGAFLAMKPYFSEQFGNADSLHAFGGKAALGLDTARRGIAGLLGADKSELFFTSGGTEANNWAVKGTARAYKIKNGGTPHVIVSAFEHASVLQSARKLAAEGFRVTELPVDADGYVVPESLADALTDDTALVSIMLANNEIGTIQPIRDLAAIARKRGVPFHADAVQAAGTLPVNPGELGVDLLTISAHKFYGPKGVGALYIRKGLKPQPEPIISGGQQERGNRGGTSNVAAAVGMAAAFKIAVQNLDARFEAVKAVRDYFAALIEAEIPFVRFNGGRGSRLPQNANFSFAGCLAATLIQKLDLMGVACASGSACSSGSVVPSHVLKALGVSAEDEESAVRFTFGHATTKSDAEFAVGQIIKAVAALRKPGTAFRDRAKSKKV